MHAGVMRDPLPLLPVALGLVAAGALLALSMGADGGGVLVMALAGSAAALLSSQRGKTAPEPAPASAETPPLPALYQHPGFAPLADALQQPLLLVEGGRVRAANAAARGLLGDFITGADIRAAIRHPAAADLLAAGQSTEPATAHLVGIGHAGQNWEMRATPLGETSRLIILIDHTGRDAVERMRADFVANASHELRTPLAAIIGYIETLSDPQAGGDQDLRRRFLGVIDTEARRMLRLIEDLLSISRIEAGKGQLPDTIIDLPDLVRQVVDELQATGDPRAGDITRDLIDAAPVRGERAQLSQLLHNILGNAMKYGRAGTPIDVRIEPAGRDMVLLSIADRGDGIPPEALPRLTERFYRVDSARSRALGGTGLGLAIVKHVAERHRGRLELASVEGEGTTVSIRLPLAQASQLQ